MSSPLPPPTSGLVLGERTYDRIKFVVTIFLPALGALYAGLAALWGFGYVEQVVGTLAVVATFLGLVMRVSSNNYEPPITDSTPVGGFNLVENPETGKKVVTLDFDRDPATLESNEQIVFRLNKKQVVENPPEENVE